ncbi:M15 family metallopeptidase [Flaviaesturariibacter flavus]|nr:M15 family metallopeptidase [Flaviaesturariibacter flavus]
MVELHTLSPGIRYDLRYATENNFTGRRLYPKGNRTFLRLLPARALASVQDSLRQQGIGLRIFDAYRPHAATRLMWELVHDERYVANPAKGSGHNRGLAVDLTLVDLKSGNELNMGTGFDNFSDSAHSDYRNLPDGVLANRRLLRGVMEAKGFSVLSTEWWHFYWPNDRDYEVLDLPFKALR